MRFWRIPGKQLDWKFNTDFLLIPAVLDHVLVQLFVELRNRLFEETLFADLSDFCHLCDKIGGKWTSVKVSLQIRTYTPKKYSISDLKPPRQWREAKRDPKSDS